MTDLTIQKIKKLNTQQQATIRQLAKDYQLKDNLQFKLDPNAIEVDLEGNMSHFLLIKDNRLHSYMLTNFYNKTDIEVTMVGVETDRFTEFLQLAISEAKAHHLTKLLLAIDPTDRQTVFLAKDANLAYDSSEYRLSLSDKPTPVPSRPELSLRQAVPADKQLIDEMDVEAFGDEHSDLKISDIPLFQLAEVNQQVIGKVRLEPTKDTVGIFAFVVSPTQRGKGYGTEILARVIQEKKQAGIGYIYIEVAVANPSALKLYEQSGFEKEATFDYYQLSID